MSIYIQSEQATAVGIETTSGQPASLTLELNALMCESADLTPSGAGTVERKGYQNGSMTQLDPIPGGTVTAQVSAVVPVHGITAAVDVGTDADWDGRSQDAVLRSAGLSAAKAAGTRTYTAQTGSGLESSTWEQTHGPLLKQALGVRGNVVWSGKGGEPSKLTFSGIGIYREAISGAVSGTTWTDDLIAPAAVDRMTLEVGSLSTLVVSGFSFDVGNTVQSRPMDGLRAEQVYACHTYDYSADGDSDPMAGTGGFVTETTDINSSTATDVIVFTSSTGGTNLNDAIYFGGRFPFDGLKLVLGTAGAGTHTVVWEYYNGSTWSTLTFGKQGVQNFQETAGTYFNLFGRPTDWASTTLNSVAGYYIRARISAFTSYTTQPLLTQAWLMYNSHGSLGGIITDRSPRLTITAEVEPTATYNPELDMRNRTTRNLTLVVGTADNSTFQLTLTAATVAAIPKRSWQNGLAVYEVVYAIGGSGSSFSWLYT